MPGATSTPCRGWATRCSAAPGPGRRPYTLPCATWRGRASTAPPVARHGRVVARGSLVRARAYARPREPRGHNDVSPMNLTDEHGLARRASRGVFGPGPPSPAPPAWDLARGARQFAPLSRDAGCARDGWSSPPDRACRLRILSDGYGLSDQDRRGFVGGGGPPHGGHGVGHRGPRRRGLCAPRAPRSQRRPDARARRQDVGRAQRRGSLDAALLGQVPGG